MKARRSLGIACLAVVGLAFAYGLGYEHGRSSAMARVSQSRSLRQIGLAFRMGHNEITRGVTASGPVAIPRGKASEDRR